MKPPELIDPIRVLRLWRMLNHHCFLSILLRVGATPANQFSAAGINPRKVRKARFSLRCNWRFSAQSSMLIILHPTPGGQNSNGHKGSVFTKQRLAYTTYWARNLSHIFVGLKRLALSGNGRRWSVVSIVRSRLVSCAGADHLWSRHAGDRLQPQPPGGSHHHLGAPRRRRALWRKRLEVQ